MNILFVIPNLEIGGAQSFLLRLASAMSKTNKVFLLNVHAKQINSKFSKQLLIADVKVVHALAEQIELIIEKRLPIIIAKYLKRVLFKLINPNKLNKLQLNHLIKKNRIEIINSHMYLADLYIYNLNIQSNVKVKWISSFHGCYNLLLYKYANSAKLSTLSKELKNILEKTDGVITAATKHNTVKKTLNITDIPFKKIYYGFTPHAFDNVDLRKKYNIPSDNTIFGMVARGDKTKGWQEAIDAFVSLPNDLKEKSYLILTGDGNYLKELEEHLKHEKRIIFTGPSDQPLREISNFDVGLLPTYYPAESLPNSIIEYLYCRKPVIATNWAEIPYMIESPSGAAGIIIPLKDNKANIVELSNAMKRCILNKGQLKEQSYFANEAFKKFEMGACIDNYMNFFKKSGE